MMNTSSNDTFISQLAPLTNGTKW